MYHLNILTNICNNFTDILDITNLEPTFDYLENGINVFHEYYVEWNRKIDRDLLYHHNPMVRYLYLKVVIYDICTTKGSFKDRKFTLVEIIKFLNSLKDPSISDKILLNYTTNKLQTIRDFQYKTNALENTVTTVSPINPYSGEYIKSYPIESFEMNLSTKQRIDILKELQDIILNDECCEELIRYGGMYAATELSLSDVINYVNNSSINVLLRRYLGLIYLAKNIDKIQTNEKELFINTMRTLKLGNNPGKSISNMESLIKDSSITSLENFAFYDDMQRQNLLEKMLGDDVNDINRDGIIDNPVEGFDIQKLINYLYTERRYRANDYTNAFFMKGQNIASCTFYKGFVLIQPKSASGQIHYIYVPVIDDAQLSKVVLVRIDREGKISIVNAIDKE